jgi:hypothetical protein
MLGGLAILMLLFFIGTFWNYADLRSRLTQQEPDVVVAMEKLRATSPTPAYQDWYMRMVLEEHAMRSRHRQNSAVVESRVWTRFMGFVTGMVMVMAGCIFILGRLDTAFDGGIKGGGYEGVLKTNSPGIVLAVAGTVLIGIALTVPVQIEVTDKPVYIADLTALGGMSGEVAMPAPAPLPSVSPAPPTPAPTPAPIPKPRGAGMPAELSDEMCKQAGKAPGCAKQ